MNMPELEDYILQGLTEGKSLDELTNFLCVYGDVQREEVQNFISQIRHGQKPLFRDAPITKHIGVIKFETPWIN